MLFQFPEGVTNISVQQQTFGADFTDDAGVSYFHAPDYLAGYILDLPGFKVPAVEPEGVPKDTTSAAPVDTAVAQLTAQVERQRIEIISLNEALETVKGERDAMVNKYLDLEARLKEMTDAADITQQTGPETAKPKAKSTAA